MYKIVIRKHFVNVQNFVLGGGAPMLDTTFGGFLAIASIAIGILVLTGHGDMFLRPGREDQRKNITDRARL